MGPAGFLGFRHFWRQNWSPRNGCSASRRGLRVTICPSRAVAIGSGLVAMIGTSRFGDITAGISDPCR
jgi:hypothetical protein